MGGKDAGGRGAPAQSRSAGGPPGGSGAGRAGAAVVGEFLLPGHWDVVAKFSKSRVLLAFDFDGTLAPIVINPAEARMRPETKELLTRVSELYPCVVISGRAGPD